MTEFDSSRVPREMLVVASDSLRNQRIHDAHGAVQDALSVLEGSSDDPKIRYYRALALIKRAEVSICIADGGSDAQWLRLVLADVQAARELIQGLVLNNQISTQDAMIAQVEITAIDAMCERACEAY